MALPVPALSKAPPAVPSDSESIRPTVRVVESALGANRGPGLAGLVGGWCGLQSGGGHRQDAQQQWGKDAHWGSSIDHSTLSKGPAQQGGRPIKPAHTITVPGSLRLATADTGSSCPRRWSRCRRSPSRQRWPRWSSLWWFGPRRLRRCPSRWTRCPSSCWR